MKNIVIATIKKWNIDNYFNLKTTFKDIYSFNLITSKEELNLENLKNINPKYIFFPHWSWIIPKDVYENYECIVFHMTDLPYGRGGSPLQNLIINKIYNTKISAIKVSKNLDEGDIYLKEDFDISKGNAQEIYEKASNIIFNKMIPKIIKETTALKKQEGEIVIFKRRTPEESNINSLKEICLNDLYDFIRMLDAQSYPKAYIKINNIKIEFSNASLENNILKGNFEVVNDK